MSNNINVENVLSDPRFVRYAMHWLLENSNIVTRRDREITAKLPVALPGFNQGETFTDINTLVDRVVTALRRQYDTSESARTTTSR